MDNGKCNHWVIYSHFIYVEIYGCLMDAINRWVDDESVWLSQKLIAELFDTTGSNITTHLNNILEHELDRNSVCKDFLHTVAEVIVERMNHKKEHMGLTTWESFS